MIPRLAGRYFFYKKAVDPRRKGRILRSYAKLDRPNPASKYLMVVEYQKAIFESNTTGRQVDHDFFLGICEKKDGVLILLTRQLYRGTPKFVLLDSLHFSANTGLLHRAFGYSMETCDSWTPMRSARSPFAIQRIPDDMSPSDVDSFINNCSADEVDEVFSSYVLSEG